MNDLTLPEGHPVELGLRVSDADNRVYGYAWLNASVVHGKYPVPYEEDFREFLPWGDVVPLGRITLGSFAARAASIVKAKSFYGAAETFAIVTLGRDEHGVWVAGHRVVPAPDSAAGPWSVAGDWRAKDGRLRLVGLVLVPLAENGLRSEP